MELVARVPKDGELGGGVFVTVEESVCMNRYVIVQVAVKNYAPGIFDHLRMASR